MSGEEDQGDIPLKIAESQKPGGLDRVPIVPTAGWPEKPKVAEPRAVFGMLKIV